MGPGAPPTKMFRSNGKAGILWRRWKMGRKSKLLATVANRAENADSKKKKRKKN